MFLASPGGLPVPATRLITGLDHGLRTGLCKAKGEVYVEVVLLFVSRGGGLYGHAEALEEEKTTTAAATTQAPWSRTPAPQMMPSLCFPPSSLAPSSPTGRALMYGVRVPPKRRDFRTNPPRSMYPWPSTPNRRTGPSRRRVTFKQSARGISRPPRNPRQRRARGQQTSRPPFSSFSSPACDGSMGRPRTSRASVRPVLPSPVLPRGRFRAQRSRHRPLPFPPAQP